MDHKKFQETFLNHFRNTHPSKDLLEMIIPIGKLSSGKVLEIYKNDYEARLLEALQENFEALWFVLGDELFFSLSQKYIDAHPSQVKDLRFYGNSMEQYIRKIEFLTNEVPFLSDLASFEILFWDVFHQASQSYQQINLQVMEHEMERVKFLFRSDITFFASNWNIGEIWKARNQEEELGISLKLDSIKIDDSFYSVFFKKNDFVKICYFNENQYKLLKIMKDKSVSLGEVLEMIPITPTEIKNLFMAIVKEEIPLILVK